MMAITHPKTPSPKQRQRQRGKIHSIVTLAVSEYPVRTRTQILGFLGSGGGL